LWSLLILTAYGLPYVGVDLSLFTTAVVCLTLVSASFACEAVRAGINGVPVGQAEAARAIGMSFGQSLSTVILPQALKNMIPSLVTQFIVLFKDTSLASIIGFMDLTKAAQVVNNREIRPFPIYLFIAVVYWVCTYSMSRYARYLEKRMGPA
jgi:ABC-type amino acid transport system permease subunit